MSEKIFNEVSTKLSFSAMEKEILSFWNDRKIFLKSIDNREGSKPFIFLEGPPFANAPPGVHHVLARIMKDAICRYKTMTGHQVKRKAGWDTHGLPVEYQVEKALNIKNKQDLEKYGVKNFIEKCRENVFRYEQDWRKMTERIGFWVDLDNPYITLSNDYIESIWWVLRQAWDKELLYHDYKVQPYCSRCGTTLASHEVAQGYQTVTDPSIYVKFKLKVGKPTDRENTFLLVWTTTPWTLPSNVAIAVGENFDYAMVEHNGENLILATKLVTTIFGENSPEILQRFKGSELLNWQYEPLFNFAKIDQKAHYLIAGDFVTLTDGTGLVHIAPAFGQEDYEMRKKHGLPLVQLVDGSGKFVSEVTPWAGEFVKSADPKIIENLEKRNLMFRVSEYEHEYPFCWRCDTPLLYYARPSWFIRTTEIRHRMLEHNQQINWYPEHIKDGRFGKWLENNIDWGLSRERYWGTPLPAWSCDDCGSTDIIGSVAELRERAIELPSDLELHRPYIDAIELKCENCDGGIMHRTEDVIDCWFDSGVAHTAQWHYPFENKEIFEANYPADFISEAIDQTRGWFYSLLVTGTLLYDKPAYKNCLCLELITGADGQKMSKSRGNTIDPWEILENQGADSLRWYLYTSCPPWTPRAFKVESIDEALRKFMGTLHNVHGFFVTYANLDQLDFSDVPSISERSQMDRWLLSKLNSLILKVRSEMENYQLMVATRDIANFVDELSNWYVRRSRARFWGAKPSVDKQSAYLTLHETLIVVAKLLAPFTPFIAETIYRNLLCSIDSSATESVHLVDFPVPDKALIDLELEEEMTQLRRFVVLGRAARNRSAIKTRQPLPEILIGGLSKSEKEVVDRLANFPIGNLLREELNIKKISVAEKLEDFVEFTAKVNFKTLGPKYGKMVKAIASKLGEKSAKSIQSELKSTGEIRLELDGKSYRLEPEDVEIRSETVKGYVLESDGKGFVLLSVELSHELLLEGFARELINKIQQTRKEADFNLSDRIELSIESSAELVNEAFDRHREQICNETLTIKVVKSPSDLAFVKSLRVNGETTTIGILVKLQAGQSEVKN